MAYPAARLAAGCGASGDKPRAALSFARAVQLHPNYGPAKDGLSRTRGVPMKRVAEIDEVVEAILFAADPKNSFMTGHTLSVDGGIAAI